MLYNLWTSKLYFSIPIRGYKIFIITDVKRLYYYKHITWLKSDQTIDFESEKNYYIENAEIENVGTKTILFFKEVNQADFVANFTCKASNSYGYSSRVINIIPMSN